jgi:3-hydroxyacyl-[acyl-carrier-protein] dehydratase
VGKIDYENLLKLYRKKKLFDPEHIHQLCDIKQDAIKNIIPHRDPSLLVDELTGIDLVEGRISGIREIPVDDPIFRGHFPGTPLYPGSQTVEMIGQLSLCLYYFLENETDIIRIDAAPVSVRASRILGAVFLEPIMPGDRVELLAAKTENDGFFARAIGQAVVGSRVCCVSAGEVCFL